MKNTAYEILVEEVDFLTDSANGGSLRISGER